MIQPWCMSHRADPAAKRLADRHYNRQKPDSPQFVPPGSCLVLLTDCARAFWVTSAPMAEYTKHEWAGAWVCSAFRREGGPPAGELIWAALAATRAFYGEPPALGLITFVNEKEVRPTMVRGVPVYGWTYLKRGFRVIGRTKGGLLALGITPADMPAPLPAKPRTMHGSPLFDACSLGDESQAEA